MQQDDNKIRVINKFDGKEIIFDGRVQKFSVIIAEDLEENHGAIEIPA